tara:strand:+ start:1149 stop:4055 length:2907 start_codon:yes stop_codon:yes gene_type:complete
MSEADATMDDKGPWIAGIGASAGGLEAIERVFTHCPIDLGVTYVVIQHLSSNYKSMMDDLIHRYTDMPVKMVSNAMPIEPNTVFLIPAGTVITLVDNVFYVREKETNTLTLPIDIFFKSLAENSKSRAIGVVLSGTGSDGSRGAMDINAQGGFVIAQEPNEAKFDGMPRSLLGTGIVDDIVLAEAIPQRICEHIQNPVSLNRGANVASAQAEPPHTFENATIETVTQLLVDKCRIDFSEYKWATFSRRLERRMQVKQVRDIQAYYDILCTNEDEVAALRRELLIPVTSFFRDFAVFEALEQSIIPRLVKEASDIDGLRIWVAGCSSGEEAYSLAMLINEEISRQNRSIGFKIFATDVNPEIIDVASRGTYPEAIAGEIAPPLLKKYFAKDGDKLTIRQDIRQNIVFAKHNILSDPPFTKMDMVSCRNTLIYFKNKSQMTALQKLQYAIKQNGTLLLGKSESLTINQNHFEIIDAKLKLFRCKQRIKIIEFESKTFNRDKPLKKAAFQDKGNDGLTKLIAAGQERLHKKYQPVSLMVNDNFDVLHFYGEPGNLVQFHKGPVNHGLSHILNKKLVPIATALLFRLKKEGGELSSEKVIIDIFDDEHPRVVFLSGEVMSEASLEPHYLLTIDVQAPNSKDVLVKKMNIEKTAQRHIEQVELELSATRESLQATIEELETTNEELQATNEELMASNEELQSSNEELQSVNEELNTVNAEYHEKMNILNQINADLDAMTKSTAVATIFVDQRLHITRFTPDASLIYKLRDSDVGRPLEEISHCLLYPSLYQDVRHAMQTGRLIEKEITSDAGKSYLVRIVDYSLSPNRSGVVLSFIDITALKVSEKLQSVLDALPEHVAVLDKNGCIVMVNNAWERFSHANGGEMAKSSIGANYLNVCDTSQTDADAKEAYFGIKSVLEGTRTHFSMEYPCDSPNEHRWFAMEVVAVNHRDYAAVVSHFNITGWKVKQSDKRR